MKDEQNKNEYLKEDKKKNSRKKKKKITWQSRLNFNIASLNK